MIIEQNNNVITSNHALNASLTEAAVLIGAPILIENLAALSEGYLNTTSDYLQKGFNSIRKKISVAENFKSVFPGSLAFFVRVKTASQAAIQAFQKWGNLGNHYFSNVTHVGIVTESSENKVKVLEMPGYGRGFSEEEYDLSAIPPEEEFLFVQSDFSRKEAFQNIQWIRSVLVDRARSNSSTENGYNLNGVFNIPFIRKDFSFQDKKNLINVAIDLLLGQKPLSIDKEVFIPKKYFCSEFVLEISQLDNLLTHLPSQEKKILINLAEQCQSLSVNERKVKVIELAKKWDQHKIWHRFLKKQFFQLSPSAATPSLLAHLAIQNSQGLLIKSPLKQDFLSSDFLSKEAQIQYLETRFSKLLSRFLLGEQINQQDPDFRKIVEFFLRLKYNYSREVTDCFIKECLLQDSSCIETCLGNNLSLLEKFSIFFTSREINRGVSSFLENSSIPNLLNAPDIKKTDLLAKELLEMDQEKFLEKAYPIALSKPIVSFENWIAKSAIKYLGIKPFLKYIPLAIMYDSPKPIILALLNRTPLSIKGMNNFFDLYKDFFKLMGRQ